MIDTNRCKMMTQEKLDTYIIFNSHGDAHYIPKNLIRDLLDKPREPDKKTNPIDNIGQVIKEDISITKILKGGIR